MQRKLRPLAPSTPSRSPQEDPPTPQVAARRKPVSLACDVCRKHKARCDGARPTCSRCRERGIICIYQADDSRVARVESLKAQRDAVVVENSRLWQLLGLLRELPKPEAQDILAQLRSTDDPHAVLRLARNISPPMPPGPSYSSQEKLQENPRLSAIGLRALVNSSLRVSARPWTLVAGDGIVSDLISSFFQRDDAFFFPSIDRDAFLEDMRSNDPSKSKYCSPLLVNAICASRSFTSCAVKSYSLSSGEDIGVKFLNEAKKLWSLESNKPSLPTVQALALLFSVAAYRGADRQGMAYRISAYEMLSRLDLAATFKQADKDGAQGTRTKAIISKALWGLFCFENIVGYVYFQQSLIPPPQVPRCFTDSEFLESDYRSFDGSPRDSFSSPRTVEGVMNASCDLSILLYRVMGYNASCQDVGSENDMAQRRRFYDKIQQLWQDLPRDLREDNNFTPQTCFIRVYIDEVVISIWRPVDADAVIENGSAGAVNDLLIHCAKTDIALSKQYIEAFGLSEYSCIVLCGMYNSILILVERLGDTTTHESFIQVCTMMRQTTADFPMASFILQSVMAIAWSLETSIPARALPYLQNLNTQKDALRDIPLAFAIPETVVVRNMFTDTGSNEKQLMEMGRLLSQWSGLTID